MRKRLSVLGLIFIMITLTACSGGNGAETPAEPAAAIEKDVSMLLKSIGDSMDMVASLGDLPKAEANGNLHYYQNAGTDGYFAGFDLGVETEADGATVKQIYIQPLGDAKITANGMVIGGTISEAKAVFGGGELASVEQNGKIVNFMTFDDETYVMKATVRDQQIVAVAITASEGPGGSSDGSESALKPDPASETKTAADLPEPSSTEYGSEELSHAFDMLFDFLDKDFSLAEDELGEAPSYYEDEYEDIAVYVSGGMSTIFSIEQKTKKVNAVMLSYDFSYGDLELPVGMAGIGIGEDYVHEADSHVYYLGYELNIMTDMDDQVYGIQAFGKESGITQDAQAEAPESYELSIEQFDTYSILSAVYDGTGEKAALVNTKGRWDGDQFFDGYDVKILKAEASADGRFVFFETDDPKMTNGYGAANNTILKYNIAEGYEEHVCLGFLYDTVKVAGYEDCIIIEYFEPSPRGGYYQPYILIDGESNYHYMGKDLEADLADQVRRAYKDEIDELAVMTPASERINGKDIDFSKYSIVVAEDYQGINTGRMETMTIQNPYYKEQGQSLFPCNFAVFGTVYNLRWEVGINMDESKVYPIADQLTDTLVTYETWRPYDPSTDTFLFEDVNGNEYRIVIEDMSDNIDLVTVP